MSNKTTPTANETITPFNVEDLQFTGTYATTSEELANESLCIDNEPDAPATQKLLAVLPDVREGALDALNGNPTFSSLKKLCALATNKEAPEVIATNIGNIAFNRGTTKTQVSWSLTDFRTKKNPSATRLEQIATLKQIAIAGIEKASLRDMSSRNVAKGQGQLMSHITCMAILRATSQWHNLTHVEQAHYSARAHRPDADAVIAYTFGTSLEGVVLATAIAIAEGPNLFAVAIYNAVATALDVGQIALPEGMIDEDVTAPNIKVTVVKNPMSQINMES